MAGCERAPTEAIACRRSVPFEPWRFRLFVIVAGVLDVSDDQDFLDDRGFWRQLSSTLLVGVIGDQCGDVLDELAFFLRASAPTAGCPGGRGSSDLRLVADRSTFFPGATSTGRSTGALRTKLAGTVIGRSEDRVSFSISRR